MGRQQRREQSRKESKADRRAGAASRQRRDLWVGRTIVAVVVIAAAALAYSFYTRRQFVSTVKTTDYSAGLHMAGPLAYTETPPMGGTHNVTWQNCRVYTTPIHNEHAVHALEHGAIWITYRPDLAAAQVEQLQMLASDDYMLVSPYPGLPASIVASAWNHQKTFDQASDPGLRTFIDEYRNNPRTTPEFGAPCSGGTSADATGDTLGGRPAPLAQ